MSEAESDTAAADLLNTTDQDELAYVAQRVGIAVGRRPYVTRHGVLIVGDGRVVLAVPGSRPNSARILASASVDEVAVLSKPWYSFGTGLFMQIGDTSYTVEPEAIDHGSPFGIVRRIRAARGSVQAFERALQEERATGRTE